MKKFIAGLFAGLLLATLPVAFSLSYAPYEYFDDIDEGEWFYQYANDLRYIGIIDGYEDNTFRGEESVNRAQLAKMIYETYDRVTKNGEFNELEGKVEQLNAKLATLELEGDCLYDGVWYMADELVVEDDWFPKFCEESGYVETRNY